MTLDFVYRSKRARMTTLALVLAAYLGLGIAYSVVVPIWEAPDESEHFWYVRHLLTRRDLPSEPLPTLQLNQYREESRQPPLYYVLAAVATLGISTEGLVKIRANPHVTWGFPEGKSIAIHTEDEVFPYQDVALAVHLVRWLSVGLGALTLLVTYLLVREVFPTRPGLAVASTAINAFIPSFVFIHSSVNNDNLIVLLANLAVLLLVKIAKGDTRRKVLLGLGVVLGLALLTKYNGIILVPFLPIIFVWLWLRGRAFPVVRASLATLVPAAAIAGWWYVRNAFFYQDPFRGEGFITPQTGGWMQESIASMRIVDFTERLFESFWGVFGWQNVRMADFVYWALAAGTVLCLAGLVLFVRRRRGEGEVSSPALAVAVLWVGAVIGTTALRDLVSYSRYGEGIDHGRFLYPAIGGISLLLATGLAYWGRPQLVAVATAGLLMLAAVAPTTYISPAYPPPVAVLAYTSPVNIERRTDVRFGNGVALSGISGLRDSYLPGETLDLTVYWRALRDNPSNKVASFQVLDARSGVRALHDEVPLIESFPPSQWREGYFARDERRLEIAESAPPGPYRLEALLYDSATMDAVPARFGPAGEPQNRVVVANFRIPFPTADADAIERRQDASFGNDISLIGYGHQKPATGGLKVVLWWKTQRPLLDDYTVSVQLLDRNGMLAAQHDGQPVDGYYPTSVWQPGDIVRDEHIIPLPNVGAPGGYTLQVVMYAGPLAQRLPVWNNGERQPDDRLVLQSLEE